LRNFYRRARVLAKQAALIEPIVRREAQPPLEFHGNDYCGWCIPRGSLRADSVVVDVGLGEDVSFSRSLMDAYGCRVHGFDPTPRAIEYVKSLACSNLVLHEYGVAARSGRATFYLPNDESHVSGSLVHEQHLGQRRIEVNLLSLADVFRMIGAERIRLLKVDIEGAEYELLGSAEFGDCAPRVDIICIEFHHRWPTYGRRATLEAVRALREYGFRCAWRASASNEEFTFLNARDATFA
jgi:FkbM family methyltransferase